MIVYCIFVQKNEKYARKSSRVYRLDFIQRDSFSNVTPKVWDPRNVSYSSHNKHHSDYYCGSQEFDECFNEKNSISTKTSSRRRLSTCVVAWLVIGLLIIAAGGVTTYFVYFSNSCKYAYHIANMFVYYEWVGERVRKVWRCQRGKQSKP
jgi:hypothetical protein